MQKFILIGIAAMMFAILSLDHAAAQSNQMLTNQFYEAAAGVLEYSQSMEEVADLIFAELNDESPDFVYIDELWDYNPNFFEQDPYLALLRTDSMATLPPSRRGLGRGRYSIRVASELFPFP